MRTHRLIVLAGVALGCAGCTTTALEQYTLRQIQSSVDYRYQATLNCLAAVADNPDALPSLCLQSSGGTRLTDMESASATTTWNRMVGSFAMQTLGVTLNRSPQEQWTVVPVADYSQMEALRCACLWMLGGPEAIRTSFDGILDSPVANRSPGPHFGVAKRLADIPPGWLCCGGIKDVPACAAYSAHCGRTWVWVMPDGLGGLSQFTLVLLDIATLDVANGVTQAPVLVTLFTTTPGVFAGFSTTSLDSLKNKLTGIAGLCWDKLEPMLKKLSPQSPLPPNVHFVSKDDLVAFFKKAIPGASEDQLSALASEAWNAANLVTFREDRTILPNYQDSIQRRIDSRQSFEISYCELVSPAHTVPYHGARTNVKPGQVTLPPTTTPSRQLVPETPLPLPPGWRTGVIVGPYSGED